MVFLLDRLGPAVRAGVSYVPDNWNGVRFVLTM